MKGMTRFYTCCPKEDCGTHRACMDFLLRQGMEPVLGVDGGRHYMAFHLPARKRHGFQRALRRWLSDAGLIASRLK